MHITTNALAAKLGLMDLFETVDQDILVKLASKCAIESAAAGATIFRKNDPGRSLYLLLEGDAKVHDDDYVVAQMSAGSCFGEMALLDEGPRSLSVTANTPAVLARIDREDFFEVLVDYPKVLEKLVGLLTRRLRHQTDQTLANLRRREDELTQLVAERTAKLLQQKEEAELLQAKAEEQRREAEFQRQRAEQSEQYEQQFLANMSHELRTPMNAVMGMTNLLLQKNPREDQLRYLDIIRLQSSALLVILNDILDISKIQAGRMALEWTDLNVAEVLDNVHKTLQFRAEEKGLSFTTFCDPQIAAWLSGDPTRLQQILINLAGNAVKFTEKGQVTVRARLLGQSDGHCRLRFEVSDTGIGMTPEQLAVVFESFRQASDDTTRKYGGTGLGLSICKELVELFGGRLEADSTPGEGSTFRFDLNLEIRTAPRKEKNNLANAAEMLRGLRILLAEDNRPNQIVATETLELLIPDVVVCTVENGREALEQVQKEDFDVILMDITMPIMDGLQATGAIRALPGHQKSIPIIAFTASVTNQEVNRCMDIGMNACVPKPFKESELLDALMTVFTGNRPAGIITSDKEDRPANTILPKENQTPSSGAAPELAFLESLTNNNPARIRKYIGLYLESAESSLPKIASAMNDGDHDALRRVVHTIKPQLKMVGLTTTAELAQDVETRALNAEDFNQLTPAVDWLVTDIQSSVVVFQRYLSENVL